MILVRCNADLYSYKKTNNMFGQVTYKNDCQKSIIISLGLISQLLPCDLLGFCDNSLKLSMHLICADHIGGGEHFFDKWGLSAPTYNK